MDLGSYIPQASVLGAAQGLVPDYAAEELQRRQIAMQEQQVGLQAQQQQQALMKAQRVQQRETAFRDTFDTMLVQGDPQQRAQKRAQLFAQFPEFRQEIGEAFKALDEPAQQSNLRSMTNIYSALNGGRADLAAGELRRRIDAEKKAGQAVDPMDEAILGMIESGNPSDVNAALGMVETSLDAITDGKLSRLAPTTEEKVFGFNSRLAGEPYAMAVKRVADDKFLAGPDGVYSASTAVSGLPMPGPISGYGGGTFDMGGRQVTPSQYGMEGGDPASSGGAAGSIPPPPPGFQIEGGQSMSASTPEIDEAASIMGSAVNAGVMTRANWNRLNMMLPPEGRAKLQAWLTQNRLAVR